MIKRIRTSRLSIKNSLSGRVSLGEGLAQERREAKQHYADMQEKLGAGWKSKL